MENLQGSNKCGGSHLFGIFFITTMSAIVKKYTHIIGFIFIINS